MAIRVTAFDPDFYCLPFSRRLDSYLVSRLDFLPTAVRSNSLKLISPGVEQVDMQLAVIHLQSKY